MDLHLFYLHGPYEMVSKQAAVKPEDIFIKDNEWYYLYAFTSNKKISKQFKKYRNMHMFVYKRISVDKDDNDYIEFMDNHLGSLLEYHLLNDERLSGDTGCYTGVTVRMIMTNDESMAVVNNHAALRYVLSKFKKPVNRIESSKIFDKKIRKILDNQFNFKHIQRLIKNKGEQNKIDDELILNRFFIYLSLSLNTYKKGCDICEIMDVLH